MKKSKFNFSVGSDLEYENLVADIGYNNQLVALLTQEQGGENMRIVIYTAKSGEQWDFSLKEFDDVIQSAKKRLWELRKFPED